MSALVPTAPFLILILAGLAGAIFLVLVILFFRKADELSKDFLKHYEQLEITNATLKKLSDIEAEIVDDPSKELQVKVLLDVCQRYLSETENPNYDDETKVKVLVHFYHKPVDEWHDTVMETNVGLLKNGFHLLWVYDQSAKPDFQTACFNRLERQLRETKDWQDKVAFLGMNDDDLHVPINFSVMAPHISDTTVTYVRFPGDVNFKFVMRVVKQSADFAGVFDSRAKKCIARLDDGLSESWDRIKGWS